MARYFILVVLMVIAAIKVQAVLNCTIVNSTCSYTDVFHISNLTNAHAEQANESDYDYVVCCRTTEGVNLSTNCDTPILNLSSSTNAHVELPTQSNYPFSVCLNATNGTISCDYITGTCTQACLGTVSTTISGGNTNLHIADCTTDSYATKLCCNYTQAVVTPTGVTTSSASAGTGLIRSEREARLCNGTMINGTCVQERETKEVKINYYGILLLVGLAGLLLLFLDRVSHGVDVILQYGKKLKDIPSKKLKKDDELEK